MAYLLSQSNPIPLRVVIGTNLPGVGDSCSDPFPVGNKATAFVLTGHATSHPSSSSEESLPVVKEWTFLSQMWVFRLAFTPSAKSSWDLPAAESSVIDRSSLLLTNFRFRYHALNNPGMSFFPVIDLHFIYILTPWLRQNLFIVCMLRTNARGFLYYNLNKNLDRGLASSTLSGHQITCSFVRDDFTESCFKKKLPPYPFTLLMI